jgi:hypothetical protein
MTKLAWTLAALSILGGSAFADSDGESMRTGQVSMGRGGSHRGVAQDYLVMPSGGEVTAQMRFLMAEPILADSEMKFTDLALFGVGGRWSVFSKLELSLEANFLAKQPSFTDEKPWQSIGGAVRSPIGKRAALQISAAGGHLIGHQGMWTKEALMIEWRKPIHELMQFDLAGGVDGVSLSAPKSSSAFITEVAFNTSVLFKVERVWGAWAGVGYAVPIAFRGQDPTTKLSVDPQPRLDVRIGTAVSFVDEWDVFVEAAVVDRGDVEDPATRLPILDGGFDQKQIVVGVTRHFEGKRRGRSHDDDDYAMASR